MSLPIGSLPTGGYEGAPTGGASLNPIPVAIVPRSISAVTLGGTSGVFNPNTGSINVEATATPTVTLIADAVVRERHEDEMVMTDQPVEQGAVITDHAYKLPAKLELTYGWSLGSNQNNSNDPNFLNNLYLKALSIQASRTLCEIVTGKRAYKNMLIQYITTESDQFNENILLLVISFREVLMAVVQFATAPQEQQAMPQATAPVVNQGALILQPAPNFNSTVVP